MMSRAFTVLALLIAFGAPRTASAQDPHAGHQQPAKPAPQAKPQTTTAEEATHDHAAHAAETPREPIPPITDADRAAAFPEGLAGHPAHDRQINTFVLFDQLEWQGDAGGGGITLENTSWIGGALHRVWLRGEAHSTRGRLESADAHVLYGRAISRWWDVVAGVRQDFRPDPMQTWAAIGIQGLAPYWFEVEATGYVGRGGRTHARVEVEYELLFTNRLILQPLVEVEAYGKRDPVRGIGAGLSSVATGLRMRYEIRRELAPYVGVTWERKLLGTAEFARDHGESPGAARLAIGLRTWF
jgi:copper resistance protein B